MKLTQDKINSLPLPKGRSRKGKYRAGEALYKDSGKGAANSLYLRLREGGSRKFIISWMQGDTRRRTTIGDASIMTLEAARQRARKLLHGLDDGKDPQTEKARSRQEAADIFLARVENYLEAKAHEMKPRSLEETRRHLLKHWKPLHRMALGKIDSDVVDVELKKIAAGSGPVAANRARSTLSAFFAWASSTPPRFKGVNPVNGTKKREEESRERVLTDGELAAIWSAADPKSDYGRIVRLLTLTACRRNEIGGVQWSEIALADSLMALPGERTKNGRPHTVPLCEAALRILEATPRRAGRDFVFGDGEEGYSGWSKAKTALDARAGVSAWTLHDLRRTAATAMAEELEVFPHVIEGVLNHVSGHKSGVAGIYNRASYEAQKRTALEAWATHLVTVLARAEGANVTTLRLAKA